MNITLEHLLDCIGEIEDIFLEEAETADLINIRRTKRKRIVKYSAAGLAVSVGVAMAYWMIRQKRAAA